MAKKTKKAPKKRAEQLKITMQADYCNCTVKTVCPMPPYEDGTSITLNARQVEKKP